MWIFIDSATSIILLSSITSYFTSSLLVNVLIISISLVLMISFLKGIICLETVISRSFPSPLLSCFSPSDSANSCTIYLSNEFRPGKLYVASVAECLNFTKISYSSSLLRLSAAFSKTKGLCSTSSFFFLSFFLV